MMARLLRLLVLLAVWGLWSLPATAVQCTQYATRTASDPSLTATGWKSSRAEACEAARASVVASNPGSTATYVANPDYGSAPYACQVVNSSFYNLVVLQEAYATRTGDYCGLECAAGTKQTKNVFMGHGRHVARSDGALWQTIDGRKYMAALPTSDPSKATVPEEICDGMCGWVADGSPGDWWAAEDPTAQGLYPVYRSQGYMKTGGSCSLEQKSPRIDSSSVSQGTNGVGGTCDGYVGQVDGKTVCVAKVPPSGWDAGRPKLTTSPAGSSAPTQTTDTTGLRGLGPNGERPGRAGDVPGLTDQSGTGTGSGTSSTPSSGTTTNGDGTTTTFKVDVQSCGLPGKPACRMDESGTPSNRDLKLDEATIDTQAQVNRNTAGGSSDKGMFSSWSSFFVTPTVGTCGPLQLPGALSQSGVVIDPCPVVDGMRSVVGFLWALGGFWLCLGWVREVI